MIGIYYAILVALAVPIYVLSEIFKDKNYKVIRAACYVILLLIILLFI